MRIQIMWIAVVVMLSIGSFSPLFGMQRPQGNRPRPQPNFGPGRGFQPRGGGGRRGVQGQWVAARPGADDSDDDEEEYEEKEMEEKELSQDERKILFAALNGLAFDIIPPDRINVKTADQIPVDKIDELIGMLGIVLEHNVFGQSSVTRDIKKLQDDLVARRQQIQAAVARHRAAQAAAQEDPRELLKELKKLLASNADLQLNYQDEKTKRNERLADLRKELVAKRALLDTLEAEKKETQEFLNSASSIAIMFHPIALEMAEIEKKVAEPLPAKRGWFGW
jgi:hypothetical protein